MEYPQRDKRGHVVWTPGESPVLPRHPPRLGCSTSATTSMLNIFAVSTLSHHSTTLLWMLQSNLYTIPGSWAFPNGTTKIPDRYAPHVPALFSSSFSYPSYSFTANAARSLALSGASSSTLPPPSAKTFTPFSSTTTLTIVCCTDVYFPGGGVHTRPYPPRRRLSG
jgi:hypothetical protein